MTEDKRVKRVKHLKEILVFISILAVAVLIVFGVRLYQKGQTLCYETELQLYRQWNALGMSGEEVLYSEDGTIDLSNLDMGELWMRVQVYNIYMDKELTIQQVVSSFLKEEGSAPEVISDFTDFYRDRLGPENEKSHYDNMEKYQIYKDGLVVAQASERFRVDHPDIAAIDFNDLTPEQLEILAEYIEE